MYFSWFLIKGQCLPPSAIAQHHVQFCFPWKNRRLVKTWKWESVCADGARSCFINPRKPCYQEAGTTATGSEKGDFPPSCSVRMQNNDQITHTHNDCWLGYFLCVLIRTCSQQVALWALSSVISAPWLLLGSLTFYPDPTSYVQEALILKVTLGSQDQESGILKRGSKLLLYVMWPTCHVFWG